VVSLYQWIGMVVNYQNTNDDIDELVIFQYFDLILNGIEPVKYTVFHRKKHSLLLLKLHKLCLNKHVFNLSH